MNTNTENTIFNLFCLKRGSETGIKDFVDVFFYWFPLLEKHFENNWDIQFQYHISHSMVIDIILFYPHVTITNKNKSSHDIKDIYVKLCTTYDVKNEKILLNLLGTRTSLTWNEYQQKYMHSHLPGVNEYFTSFCIGSEGVFPTMIAYDLKKLKNLKNPDIIEYFLFSLASFLSYESLEGTPHRRMSSVNVSEDEAPNFIRQNHSEILYMDMLDEICNSPKDFSFKKNPMTNKIEIVENEIFIEKLKNLIIYYDFSPYLGFYINDKFCITTKKIYDKILYCKMNEFYQGKNMFLKIADEKNTTDNIKQIEKSIYKPLKEFIIYNINTYIHDKYFEYQTKQLKNELSA